MSEKKLPKGVTQALNACQKHLDKAVKYMDDINQRKPIAPSKRTTDALGREKRRLLDSIEKLRDVEKKHGLTNIASDFVNRNNNIVNLCSDEGPGVADRVPGSSAPKSRGAPTEKLTVQSSDLHEGPVTANLMIAASTAKSPDVPADTPTTGGRVQSPDLPGDPKGEPAEDQQQQADRTTEIVPAPTSCTENQPSPALRAEGQPTPDVAIAPPSPKTGEASLAVDVEAERDGENKRKRVHETESESGHGVKARGKKHTKKFKRDESSDDSSESSDTEDSESSDEDSDESMPPKKKASKHKHKRRHSKKSKRSRRGKGGRTRKSKSKRDSTTGTESDTTEEEETKIFNKKGKDIAFRDLPDEEKQKEEERAKNAIREFLMEPLTTQVDPHVRRLIRENQTVAPEAATTSRELALECFTTLPMNVICPYHQKSDKSGKTVDGGNGLKFVLNGVPRPRKTVPPAIAKKLKKKASALYKQNGQFRDPRLREGFLHCGCPIDEALMDFYFWKTWSISGVVDDKEVTESMAEQRMTPRIRAFVVKAFEAAACLTIDDLYSGKLPPWRHQEKMYHTQLERILAKYNKLQEEIPGSIKLRLEKESAPEEKDFGGF